MTTRFDGTTRCGIIGTARWLALSALWCGTSCGSPSPEKRPATEPIPAARASEVESPAPPSLSDTALPEAVRQAFTAARAEVLRQPSSENWGRLGQVLMSHFYYPEASTCFAQAIQLDPREARWRYCLALVQARSDPASAIAAYRKTCELAPQYAPAWLNLAQLLWQAGDATAAETAVRQAMALAATEPKPRLVLAQILFSQNRLADAQRELENGAAMSGAGADICRELARLALRAGDTKRAARWNATGETRPAQTKPLHDLWVIEVRQLDSRDTGAFERAGSLAKQGAHGEAADLYRKIIDADPNHAQAHMYLGSCLIALQQPAEAAHMLRRACQLTPNEIEAWSLRGLAYGQLQNWHEAAVAYRRALELKPDYPQAAYDLGVALKHQGLLTDARDAFRTCVALRPQNGDAHFALGMTLHELGAQQEALAAYRLAVQCRPDHVPSRVLLAVTLIDLGFHDEADLHLKKAEQLAPNEAHVRNARLRWRETTAPPK